MNTRLKRIEATLQNLGSRQTKEMEFETVNNDSRKPEDQSVSFRISPPDTNTSTDPTPIVTETEQTQPSDRQFESKGDDAAVPAFSIEDSELKAPNLPKFKTPHFSSHRNAANPALAMNMLQEIQQIIAGWQLELQTLIRQIQDIYIEGPIVNGWLESYKHETELEPEPEKSQLSGGTATLRHGEVDQLMDYVEELCSQAKEASKKAKSATAAGYKLCGLDSSGKMWTRPCPSEQVAGISMAIARYQKLRQLLGRKQYLEFRLNQLAETLVMLHGHIKEQ